MTSKLELFGILAAEPDIDIKSLVQRLKVPYAKLIKWRKEYHEQITADEIASTVAADEIVISRVSQEVAKQISDATINDLVIDTQTDEIVSIDELQKRTMERYGIEAALNERAANELKAKEQSRKEIKRLADGFKDKITGLQALQGEIQATAGTLVNKIAAVLIDEEDKLAVKDLTALSSALSSLYGAFFNRPTTNVQVNNVTGDSSLDEFRANLRN